MGYNTTLTAVPDAQATPITSTFWAALLPPRPLPRPRRCRHDYCKTNDGFEIELSEDVLDDAELLDALGGMQDATSLT